MHRCQSGGVCGGGVSCAVTLSYCRLEMWSGDEVRSFKYKDIEAVVKIEEVDGEELVKKFAEEMEEMLGRKMKSVKRLAEAAEDADLYHEYNETLKFEYFNSMLINKEDEDGNPVSLGGEFALEKNEHFNKLPVNTQLSNIQVPTNVYNRDPDILNGAYLSEALNDVFIDNFQKDPTLTWQYFGSAAGFFRLYPGIQWIPDENGVVTFDCRNRNWYIQAATSPKDVVIVVDVSGSMKGLRLTIAKHTINTILDTLGENDFVNIIAYSDYVRYVEPCFKGTLVQADLDNREVTSHTDTHTHTHTHTHTDRHRHTHTLGQGSLCNQAIMLITDGAMEDFQSVFEEFNWPERRVRVFTYLIGREMTFAENVKWIACNNKGYYTHVSTLADVQENVMEYLHVLSRPMVINHDHDIIWTEAYMDSVVSLLLPCLSHGILLGVVGTDVALKELMRLAPRYKLGVHGYAYLITNNGYILSHPDLRPLYKEGKMLKPKPNYNSVDLAEVEWEDTEEKLRTAMVKGETGTLALDVRASLDKGRRVMFLKNDYFYTVINETPFSLGIVLTRGYGQYIFIGNVSVEEGLHDLLAPDLTIASEWTYCETDIDPAHRKLTQLQAVVRYLTGKEPDLECDVQLLQQTLFDAVVTAPMEAYWTALMLNTSGDCFSLSLFLSLPRSFLNSVDKENMFTLDHFPVWYRRASEYPAGQFLYYTPRQETRGTGDTFTEQTHIHKHTWTDNTLSVLFFISNVLTSAHKKRGDNLQPCDTEYPSFVYEPSVKETNSIIKCGRCQKMFVVQQIPDSNLLMLVVQADCDCSRQYTPITMAPEECDRMRSQKIRRRPESCHAYHPQENANDCGGASVISLSAALFLTCLSFLTLVS
uniref:Calcium voltage-gated channel auxiliary subunit alpha2delta 4 n=1 Tax=Cyclopterus lumpus TaxID=8103 RepID=A0A8C2ZDR2_CYCLU